LRLRRICKGVHRVPYLGRKTAPVFLSVLGVFAAERGDAACLYGLSPLTPDEGPLQPSATPSRQARMLDVSSHMPQIKSCCRADTGLVRPAGSRRVVSEPKGRPQCRRGRDCPGVSGLPVPQTPSEKTECTDDKVVSNRAPAVRLRNGRALWRKDKQRREPARCGDCDLRFLFPQSSQHLPFPFRNARVEVGPTVMEG
jgi:hypothetical protein